MNMKCSMVLLIVSSLSYCSVHGVDTPDSISTCFPDYESSGSYFCNTKTETNVNTPTCTVLTGTHSCRATNLRFDSTQPKTLYYKLKITLGSYVENVHIQIQKSQGDSMTILDSFNVPYYHEFGVAPKIVCKSVAAENSYSSKYQCAALVTDNSMSLSQFGGESSDCSPEIKESPTGTPSFNLIREPFIPLKKKEYEVKIEDMESKCNKVCQINLVTTDMQASNQVTKVLHHVTTCPGPKIFCNVHNTNSMEISCKIQIQYPFDHVKVSTDTAHYSVEPDKIPSAMLPKEPETLKIIKYSITNLKEAASIFKIKFEVHQTTNTVVHTIEENFKYILKDDEKPRVICRPSEEVTTVIGDAIFLCDTISKTSGIELKIEPSEGTLDGSNPGESKKQELHFVKNYKVIITPTSIQCSQLKTFNIFFQEVGDKIVTSVNHIITCPEPIISCNNHNAILRRIICDITVLYSASTIEITEIGEKVRLTLNPADITNIKKNDVKRINIDYTILDAKNIDKSFKIQFKVKQDDREIIAKQLNFQYKRKDAEIPRLRCVVKEIGNPPPTGHEFESTLYSCSIISKTNGVTITTDNRKYRITSSVVTVEAETTGIYIKNDHVVKVIPYTIVCKDTEDVTFYFESENNKYPYTVTHTTHCPEPKIIYTQNDAFTRTLNLKINIEYPFEKILISSLHPNVAIKPSEIEYVDETKEYTEAIKYEIVDLKESNHIFDIRMRVMQSGNRKVYEDTRRFTYELRSDEVPGIKCTPVNSQEYYKMKYSCRIVSLNEDIALKLDMDRYSVEPETITGRSFNKIFKLDNQMVTITSRAQLCQQHNNIKISFEDQTKHEYTLSHVTQCPAPIIECVTRDLVQRKIRCGIQIIFPFEKITLTSSSDTKVRLNPSSINSHKSIITSIGQKEISYTVENYFVDDHTFHIDFEVEQSGQHKAYKTQRHFRYVLSKNEIPYIECTLVTERGATLKFSESEYECNALSKTSNIDLKIDPNTYTVSPTSISGTLEKSIYTLTKSKITIKATTITCGKDQILTVSFGEASSKIKTTVIHRTNCPEPSITGTPTKRSISYTLSAPYEFESLTLESDSTKVSIDVTPSTPIVNADNNVWTSTPIISFQPTDWSQDYQIFSIITKLTLTDKSMQSKKTQSYTVQLIETEKSRIECSNAKIEANFKLTEFTCEIISRKPSIQLSSSPDGYKILEEKGIMIIENNVYKWKGYKIVIHDQKIQCDTPVSIEIGCKVDSSIKTTFEVTTKCPDALINCEYHDQLNRTIPCVVTSEYPYNKFEFTHTGTSVIDLTNPTNQEFESGVYSSTHHIKYQPKNLNGEAREFKIKFSVKQGTKEITIKELTYSYIILPKEIPQIDCVEKVEDNKQDITKTLYSCYMVSKTEKPSISLENPPEAYQLTSAIGTGTSLKGRYMWDKHEILIEDTKMKCNQTTELTLKLTDDSNNYYTKILHTTYCHQIVGDCIIHLKDTTYVFCNFTSAQNFKLNSVKCSEHVECDKENDLTYNSQSQHEYIFYLNPRSTNQHVEFDLNVTFSYSSISNVDFTYHLEYNRGGEVSSRTAAASTGIVPSSVMIVGGLALAFFVLILQVRGKKKPLVVDYAA